MANGQGSARRRPRSPTGAPSITVSQSQAQVVLPAPQSDDQKRRAPSAPWVGSPCHCEAPHASGLLGDGLPVGCGAAAWPAADAAAASASPHGRGPVPTVGEEEGGTAEGRVEDDAPGWRWAPRHAKRPARQASRGCDSGGCPAAEAATEALAGCHSGRWGPRHAKRPARCCVLSQIRSSEARSLVEGPYC